MCRAAYSATLSTLIAIPVAKALKKPKFFETICCSNLGAFILPVIVAVLGLILVFGNNGVVNNILNLIGLPIKIYGFGCNSGAHIFQSPFGN